MARKLKPGDNVNGYTITDLLNVGGMAVSYAAQTDTGNKVFLKQYKSPSVTLDWYKDYVRYQADLKRRIEASPLLKTMTVRFVDTFEAPAGPMTYFQVFEYVKGGEDLEQLLDRMQVQPSLFSWSQRLIFAKVIVTCINAIHMAGIVHCDLKPPNLQLFRDPDIKSGYRLKLIDLDFSLLEDKQAPWHGKGAYVGSPSYFSPEHLRGDIPVPASDIFTCGLILHELLAEGGHPYRFGDELKYRNAALDHTAPLPKLACLHEEADDGSITRMLHRCLSPKPSQRPKAGELLDALNTIPAAALSTETPIAHTVSSVTPMPAMDPPATKKIELKPESGASLFLGIRTQIGKNLCRGCGADAQYMDTHQFTLDKNSADEWSIIPNNASTNDTMLNGKAIVEPAMLKDGDIISIGRESKGIMKLPLTVCFL
jgi:serine/threonine protein kinase